MQLGVKDTLKRLIILDSYIHVDVNLLEPDKIYVPKTISKENIFEPSFRFQFKQANALT